MSLVYDDLDSILNALEEDKVDGLLMNQLSAAYYLKRLNNSAELVVGRKYAADPYLTIGMVRTKYQNQSMADITHLECLHNAIDSDWFREEQIEAIEAYEVRFERFIFCSHSVKSVVLIVTNTKYPCLHDDMNTA